jgi:pimeloyl-ACP methyl ester carboxylesterase
MPIFKGLYQRGEGPANRYLNDQNVYSDFVIQCSKDLGRTIDYLETRADIRFDKLAFLGTSLGAAPGSILPAVESRLKACVFVSGGINPRAMAPHVDQINFLPRVRIPTLMLNGRYDFIFPEPSQRQMFRLLGAPPEHKQHLVFDVGHVVKGENRTKETLAWLDRYLGPIQ